MGNSRIGKAEGSRQVRGVNASRWQRSLALGIAVATMIVACASEDAEFSTHR